jgi:signal transduction histidine kinase
MHLVALVVIQLILVWSLITFVARQDFRRARADSTGQVTTTATIAAGFVAEEIDATKQSLTELPAVLGSISPAALCQMKEETVGSSEQGFVVDALLYKVDGSPLCKGDTDGSNVRSTSWFKAALSAQEPVATGPFLNPVNGQNSVMCVIAVPEVDTVVVYAIRLSSLGLALDKQFATGSMPPAFVVASADRTTEIASSKGGTSRPLRATGFVRKLSPQTNTFADLEGIERIYAEAEVPGVGWRLFAGISTADAFAGPQRAVRERVWFAVLMLLIVFAAAFVIQRRFLRPIRSLVAATKRFKDGDPHAAIDPRGPTELSALGTSFNEMMSVRDAAQTALQRAMVAEQRANSELREVDEMRNSFLMAISHELRTPLTSVVGYSEFLEESGAQMSRDEIQSAVSAIAEQSKRLQRLLVDLLDVERISRGTIEPNIKETNIRDVLMGVVERCSANQRIKVVVNGPVTSYVDSALTERMVENLVVNAIKHTPLDTRIWVKASRSNGVVRLTVEDSGPGVPDDLKTTIFEPFVQGKVPGHSPGTGVGLSLVSQFAKLQGGRAWVEDRRGGGASFKVILPADERPKHKVSLATTGSRRKRSTAA